MPLDLNPAYLKKVEHILSEQVPECEVRAFGSRVKGTARKYSDLDLALIGPERLGLRRLIRLSVALEQADLPIGVDVLDWHSIPESFRRGIERDYVVLLRPDPHSPAT